MTTESRMREALKKARSAIQYQRLPSIDLLNAYDAISEALSPPARRTSYEFDNAGAQWRVVHEQGGWTFEIESKRHGGFWFEPEPGEELGWTGMRGLAAAIATLAGLTEPEEKA